MIKWSRYLIFENEEDFRKNTKWNEDSKKFCYNLTNLDYDIPKNFPVYYKFWSTGNMSKYSQCEKNEIYNECIKIKEGIEKVLEKL